MIGWFNIHKYSYHFHRRHTGQLKPYEYFLNYKHTPFKVASLSTDTLHSIQSRQMGNHFHELLRQISKGKINHNLAQRLIKSHILLIYLESNRIWHHFMKQANYFFADINHYYQDHKYSEVYEEGIINKLVQIFKKYLYFNKQAKILDTCIFLDRVISYNQKLHNQIWKICNEFNIKLDQERNDQLTILSIYKSFERKPIPQRLFKIINEPIEYTRSYNNFTFTNRQNYFQQTFLNNCIENIKNNIDDYTRIIQNQANLFKNVRLTNWDYLIAIQFILSKGHYNSNLFQRVKDYIEKNRELWKQQTYLSQGTHLFQSMLLCNILQHITRNFDSYIFQDNVSKKVLKSRFSSSYQFYIDKLAESLEKITFQELFHALSNHFKIFNKYLLTTFDDEKTLNRFKNIYFQLFQKIFEYSDNGILLIESAGDISFIFEVILSVFTIEDYQKVLILMQKYEKLLMLNPKILQKSVSNIYHTDYIVCIKYGFKSDVLAQKLLAEIDLGLHVRSLNRKIRNSLQSDKRNSITDDLFKYFIYMSLVQTKTSQYDIVDQLWKKGFSCIELKPQKLQIIMYTPQQTKRKYLQALPQKNLPLQNSRASSINLILVMMSRLLQEEKHKDLIQEKYYQLCRNQHTMSLIRQQIAYPSILHNFINIFELLTIQDSQITQIVDQIKSLVVQSYNPNQNKCFKTYERVYYQQFNNYIHNFAVFVEDFSIYRAKKLPYLVQSNPGLEQMIKRFKSTQISLKKTEQKSQLYQQIEQISDQINEKHKDFQNFIQAEQRDEPIKAFFKRSSISLQEKNQTILLKDQGLIKKEKLQSNKLFSKRQQKSHRKPKKQSAKDQQYFSGLREVLQKINDCFIELKMLKTAAYPEYTVVNQVQIQEIKKKSKKSVKPKEQKTKNQLLKKIQTLRKSKSSSKK